MDGIVKTMAVLPGRSVLANILAASPVQISVLNSVVLAAIVALLALQLELAVGVALGLGLARFVAGVLALRGMYEGR